MGPTRADVVSGSLARGRQPCHRGLADGGLSLGSSNRLNKSNASSGASPDSWAMADTSAARSSLDPGPLFGMPGVPVRSSITF